MENEKNPQPIDLIRILNRYFKHFRRLWVIPLVLAIALGGLNFLWKRLNYVPYYQAEAIFTVSSGYGEGDIFTSSQYYDSAAASQLSKAFPHMLNMDMMRNLMLSRLDTTYINGFISAQTVGSSNLLQLTVQSSDPQDAYDILWAVIECYPEVAVYMIDNPLVVIRQEPVLPTTPINPFSGTSALIQGMLAGVFLGLLVIAVPALLSRTIETPEELKKTVNLPLLATVPHVKQRKHRPGGLPFLNAADDPALAESLRGLRVKLKKQLAESGGKIILLTSTVPGEGKSTISANLALSLADEGTRVLLLDGDLRNQSISRMFGQGPAKTGLMELLKNPRMGLHEALRMVPGTRLTYISGTSTRKRHYSIDSKSFRRLLDSLTSQFDYVVLDCPPCGVVSDAALLSRHADCVVYVVRRDHAGENQILDAVTDLYQRDIPLSGCVLNDAMPGHSHTGYGYGYGYGKDYGKKRRQNSQNS